MSMEYNIKNYIRKINESMKNSSDMFEDNRELLYKISAIVQDMLNELFPGQPLEFPIDVHEIAHKCGIEVMSKDLNAGRPSSANKLIGQLVVGGNQGPTVISIDSSATYTMERYALAIELGHYLQMQETENGYVNPQVSVNYAIPLMTRKSEEFMAEFIAVCLLLPLKLFKEKFHEYIRKQDTYPLEQEEWLSYLSMQAQISEHNLGLAYYYMKQLMYVDYKKYVDNKRGQEEGQIADYEYIDIFA